MNKLYIWVLDIINSYNRKYYIWKHLKGRNLSKKRYERMFNNLHALGSSIRYGMRMKHEAKMLYENDIVLNDIRKLMEKHYKNRERELIKEHKKQQIAIKSDRDRLSDKISKGSAALCGINSHIMNNKFSKTSVNLATKSDKRIIASSLIGFNFERDED